MEQKFQNGRLRLRKFRLAMLLLGPVWLMPFQNCSQFKPQHTPSPTGTSALSIPANLDGAKLYADNCAGCHGAIASSNKLGRSDTQISGAIGNIPQMMSQGNLVSLTNDQIRAIATALGGSVTTVPGTSPTPAPIGACQPGAVRGVAKEAVRRLTRSELKSSVHAVLPNAGFLDPDFENYPDPDVNEDVAKYDQLYSQAQAEIWTNMTDLIADKVIADRLYDRMDGACLGTSPITDACWDSFFKNYGRKVFRRPLQMAEVTRLKGYVLPLTSPAEAIRQAIHLLFRSPDFLFHVELGRSEETLRVRLSDHEVANRISYALLGSPPDGELSSAADRGELKTLAQVNSQALRLINQPTARAKLNRFFAEWLQVSAIKTPGWEYFEWIMGLGKTPGMDAVYRREIMDYVDYIAFRKKGNFQDLMTSPIAFPRYQGVDYGNNDKPMSALAGIYGNDKYSNFSTYETNEPTPFPAPNNPGLLSRAGFHVTSRLSTDPINRGVFVLRRFLCVNLPSPDFSVVSARLADTGNLDPVMIPNHQIVSKRTEPTNCMQCHSKINPMGFALEPFDVIGKRRNVESVIDMKLFYEPERGIAKTHPLLSTVTGVDFGDKTANITSPEALADMVATSKQAQACMSTFVLRHFDRRKENSGDSCQVEEVAAQLAQGRPLIDVFVNSIANEDIFWRRK